MSENPNPNRTIQCAMQPEFFQWMQSHPVSLAVTTYQAGKLLFIGWNGETVSLHAKNFNKAMGLDFQGNKLALATLDEIQVYSNDSLLAPDCVPAKPRFYDALYVPRLSYFTGNLFTHDLAWVGDELWFVNTRFSCLATASNEYNFVPRWQPPFITDLAPEDRCHLNGLAVCDGKPRTVTALGVADVARAWSEHKQHGGVVMDIESGKVLLDGLAMPHSPRWYDNRLWVLNSGAGELLLLDQGGNSDVICRLPAYLRGLAFYQGYAVVGLCQIREKQIFGGMPIENQGQKLMSGVAIVDLSRKQCVGIFEFVDGVDEIYDIRILEHSRQPNLFLWEDEGVEGAITTPDFSYWIKSAPEQNPEQDVRSQELGVRS